MITVIARLKSKPGQETLLAQGCMQLAREVREKEEGCLMYIPHVAADNPAEILFVEKYVDQAAFDAHVQTPYFKTMTAQFRAILTEEPSLQIMKELA